MAASPDAGWRIRRGLWLLCRLQQADIFCHLGKVMAKLRTTNPSRQIVQPTAGSPQVLSRLLLESRCAQGLGQDPANQRLASHGIDADHCIWQRCRLAYSLQCHIDLAKVQRMRADAASAVAKIGSALAARSASSAACLAAS